MRKNKKLVMTGITALAAAALLAGSVEYASHSFPLSSKVEAKADETKSTAEEESSVQADAVSDGKIEKQESVYTTLDASGNVQKVIVSDWLKNAGIDTDLADVSELEDIVNTKGEETFTQDADSLTWKAGTEDIYYQGTTDKELPVGMEIVYALDGKETEASELVGKSGKLTIKITYTNNTQKQVTIDGKEEEIVTPFMMVTGVILPTENFKNIRIDNGEVLSEGKNDVVVAYGLPGLAESLKLSELSFGDEIDMSEIEEKITDTVTITADVTDFEMGATYTMATPKLFEKLNMEELDGMDDLSDALDELKDAAKDLVDGADKLDSNLAKLDKKFAEYEDGVKTVKDSTKTLKNGAASLSQGVKDYTEGTDALLSGVTDYTKGTKKFSKGVKSYTDNTEKLVNAMGQLEAGVQQLSGGAEALGSNLDTYVTTVNGLIAAMEAQGGDTETLEQLKAAGEALVSAYNNQLKTGAQQLEDSAKKIYTSGSTLTENNALLESSADELISNAKTINTNAGKILSSSKELRSGASELADGSEKLASGVTTLYGKTGDVSDALGKLSSGAGDLSEGMTKFEKDGILELTGSVEDLTDSASIVFDRMDALVDAAKAYQSFAGIDANMDGNVKFIFTTEEISEE